jgi:hypothetical protein
MLICRTPNEESSTFLCATFRLVCERFVFRCVTFRLVCERFGLYLRVVRMSFVSVSYYMCELSQCLQALDLIVCVFIILSLLDAHMYLTRALIGRNLCLDQAIQTRKFKVKVFFSPLSGKY